MVRIFSQYVSAKSILLFVTESVLITLSLLCAVKLRFWNDAVDLSKYVILPDFAIRVALVVTVSLMCFYCNDLYDLSADPGSTGSILRIEQSLGAASLLLGLAYFIFPRLLLSQGVFIIGMVLAATFVVFTRTLLDKAWKLTAPVKNLLILGTGQLAKEIARELTRRSDLNIKLHGFVSGLSSNGLGEQIFGYPVVGAAADLEMIAREGNVSRVIVALEDRRGALPIRELVTLRVQGLRVDDAPTVLSELTGRVSLRAIRPSWLVFSEGFHRSKWNDLMKRVLDLFFSIIGFLLSLPLMAVVALLVRLDSKGPILYRQTRVARLGKTFEVLKFRSMQEDAEKHVGAQWANENDPRITRVGRFMRKYRLDELPQFWNVIRGDMSFVGPRPERPVFVTELRKTIPYYDERHSVRPGITGWAQVQYCYGASIEDAFNKLEYDLFYLKNMSLAFDLAIIFQTIKIVLAGRGGR